MSSLPRTNPQSSAGSSGTLPTALYPYGRYDLQALNWACDKVNGETLRAHYNEKTAQRLCLTYELVKPALEQKISRAMDGLLFILRHIRNPPSRNNPPANIYTFGGLEMNTDILTHPQPTDRHATFPLPLCVYGSQLNRATTSKVCRVFPLRRRLLQLSQLAGFRFAAVTDEEEVEMQREFLEIVRSDEEQEEPQFLRG